MVTSFGEILEDVVARREAEDKNGHLEQLPQELDKSPSSCYEVLKRDGWAWLSRNVFGEEDQNARVDTSRCNTSTALLADFEADADTLVALKRLSRDSLSRCFYSSVLTHQKRSKVGRSFVDTSGLEFATQADDASRMVKLANITDSRVPRSTASGVQDESSNKEVPASKRQRLSDVDGKRPSSSSSSSKMDCSGTTGDGGKLASKAKGEDEEEHPQDAFSDLSLWTYTYAMRKLYYGTRFRSALYNSVTLLDPLSLLQGQRTVLMPHLTEDVQATHFSLRRRVNLLRKIMIREEHQLGDKHQNPKGTIVADTKYGPNRLSPGVIGGVRWSQALESIHEEWPTVFRGTRARPEWMRLEYKRKNVTNKRGRSDYDGDNCDYDLNADVVEDDEKLELAEQGDLFNDDPKVDEANAPEQSKVCGTGARAEVDAIAASGMSEESLATYDRVDIRTPLLNSRFRVYLQENTPKHLRKGKNMENRLFRMELGGGADAAEGAADLVAKEDAARTEGDHAQQDASSASNGEDILIRLSVYSSETGSAQKLETSIDVLGSTLLVEFSELLLDSSHRASNRSYCVDQFRDTETCLLVGDTIYASVLPGTGEHTEETDVAMEEEEEGRNGVVEPEVCHLSELIKEWWSARSQESTDVDQLTGTSVPANENVSGCSSTSSSMACTPRAEEEATSSSSPHTEPHKEPRVVPKWGLRFKDIFGENFAVGSKQPMLFHSNTEKRPRVVVVENVMWFRKDVLHFPGPYPRIVVRSRKITERCDACLLRSAEAVVRNLKFSTTHHAYCRMCWSCLVLLCSDSAREDVDEDEKPENSILGRLNPRLTGDKAKLFMINQAQMHEW
ncbi:unnamed protein product [Amoebophrya sp. A25]|nr:unnamed protein product [Amoebophrya sp. A25]|eukprot:GSA25T00025652001.1